MFVCRMCWRNLFMQTCARYSACICWSEHRIGKAEHSLEHHNTNGGRYSHRFNWYKVNEYNRGRIHITCDAHSLNLLWFYIFHHGNSVGIQKNPTLTWGGQYKNITEFQVPLHNVNGSIITEGVLEITLLDPIVENSQYVVRAHVIDSYGCHGEDGNFTYLVGTLCWMLDIYQREILT